MSDLNKIRNFSIIAHIDHGKSTLSDRMLEVTKTIDQRKMRAQVLDSMDLERERGITIKMQPVMMTHFLDGIPYTLNLIDTPGHIDFSYEVSRALRAVEGALLLVDATQGVQAQTLTVLAMARELGLTIIPVLNKVDLLNSQVEDVREEIVALLGCERNSIIETSGKTGYGVERLLGEIIAKIPAPKEDISLGGSSRSLVFDFEYSAHKGIIVFVRVFNGKIKSGDNLVFLASNERFEVVEVGIFSPEKKMVQELGVGQIGYIVTGIKKIGKTKVGDTITHFSKQLGALVGYMEPRPVVWASIYPESQNDFTLLRQALERLQLSDSSLTYDEDLSTSIGRGYKCGFLGMLHLEIITERLRREFNLSLIITSPTVSYLVEYIPSGKKEMIHSASLFPDDSVKKKVSEPWVSAKIITPPEYLGEVMQILHEHEVIVGSTEVFGDKRNALEIKMPLRELMRNFFDKLKSVSSGFASLSYQIEDLREADVLRVDVRIGGEIFSSFSRVVSRRVIQEECDRIADKLKGALPRQMFDFKIQIEAMGRIVSSRSVSGMKKDVADYLYGGDITRKMKLREKQKRGKKKMKNLGKINIPQEVFLKVIKSGD